MGGGGGGGGSGVLSRFAGPTMSGSITADSFQAAGASLGNWEAVVQYFDADQSGTIEEREFINGERRPALLTFMPTRGCLARSRSSGIMRSRRHLCARCVF